MVKPCDDPTSRWYRKPKTVAEPAVPAVKKGEIPAHLQDEAAARTRAIDAKLLGNVNDERKTRTRGRKEKDRTDYEAKGRQLVDGLGEEVTTIGDLQRAGGLDASRSPHLVGLVETIGVLRFIKLLDVGDGVKPMFTQHLVEVETAEGSMMVLPSTLVVLRTGATATASALDGT